MIPKEIMMNHCLEPYKNNWYKGRLQFPNKLALHFFKEDDNYIFNITIQDYDNEKVIDHFLEIIDNELERQKLNFSKLNIVPLSKIELFDNMIFAPFEYTLIPSSDNADFDNKRVYIYPVYCCELSGKESKKDIKNITRNILSTSEWNRKPSPLVQYKFSNPKHQYGTIGKSLVINKESNVYSALSKFETDDCLMEVKNLLNEYLRITFSSEKKSFKLEGSKTVELTFDETKKYIEDFLRKCS